MLKKTLFLFVVLALTLVSVPNATAQDVSTSIATTDRAIAADIPPSPPLAEGFYQPRQLKAVVLHHSGSFPASDSPEANAAKIQGYRNYHMHAVHPGTYADKSTWAWHQDAYTGEWYQMPAQEGFPDGTSAGIPAGFNYNDIDYHYLVGTDGLVYRGRDLWTVGWHSSNWEYNLISIGVCVVGCFSAQEPNQKQYWATVDLVSKLMVQHRITEILPHRYTALLAGRSTDCPGYAFPLVRMIRDCRRQAGLYNDFDFNHWAHPAVVELSKRDIVIGYPDGSLKPDDPITRAEFVHTLWRMSGSPEQTAGGYIDTWGHWANQAVTWANGQGLIRGYPDGFFRPDKPITRAEMAEVVFKYEDPFPLPISLFPDVGTWHWASMPIASCHAAGLVAGYPDGTFKPEQKLERDEAFAVLERVLP